MKKFILYSAIIVTALFVFVQSRSAHAGEIGYVQNLNDKSTAFRLSGRFDNFQPELELRNAMPIEECSGNLNTGVPPVQCSFSYPNQSSFGVAYIVPIAGVPLGQVFALGKLAVAATYGAVVDWSGEGALGLGVELGGYVLEVRELHQISTNSTTTQTSLSFKF